MLPAARRSGASAAMAAPRVSLTISSGSRCLRLHQRQNATTPRSIPVETMASTERSQVTGASNPKNVRENCASPQTR